ncbi:MAG: hypothetical protein AB8E82_07545 [Aureispira sp.]
MKNTILGSSIYKNILTILVINVIWFSAPVQSHAQCSSYRNDCCHKFSQTHLRLGSSLHGIGGPATPRLGATIGLIQELHLLPWIQLRAEGNIVWQGREDHFWAGNGDVDYFSINVPLMLQIMPSRNFYVAGGLGWSYLAHAQGGPMPNNRSGLNWVGLMHYRFFCSRAGLELRWNQRFQRPNAPSSTDVNGNIIAPFNDTSLQLALTIRLGR